jgi:hypothetical protein
MQALMDSGKALARSGELLIDVTSFLDIYGGGLSAAGAQIRNSGDCIAQAAASCRFKTAAELVCDELRESATCLSEATDKLTLAIEEANADKNFQLAKTIGEILGMVIFFLTLSCYTYNFLTKLYCTIFLLPELESMVLHLGSAGRDLEEAGACIMMKQPIADVGIKLEACGKRLEVLSKQVVELAPEQADSKLCSQRMAFAAERMVAAADELRGSLKPKAKGKGWLKQ